MYNGAGAEKSAVWERLTMEISPFINCLCEVFPERKETQKLIPHQKRFLPMFFLIPHYNPFSGITASSKKSDMNTSHHYSYTSRTPHIYSLCPGNIRSK